MIADLHDGTSFTALASETIRSKGDDFRGVMHYPEGPIYQHNRTPNTTTPDDWRGALCVSIPKAPCINAYSAYNNRQVILFGVQQPAGDSLGPQFSQRRRERRPVRWLHPLRTGFREPQHLAGLGNH
jgi:hypothetical protein